MNSDTQKNNIVYDLIEMTKNQYPNKSQNEQATIAMLTLLKVFKLPYFQNRYPLFRIKSCVDNKNHTIGLRFLNNISGYGRNTLNNFYFGKNDIFDHDLDEFNKFIDNDQDREVLKRIRLEIGRSESLQDLKKNIGNAVSDNRDLIYHLDYIDDKTKFISQGTSLIKYITNDPNEVDSEISHRYKTKLNAGAFLSEMFSSVYLSNSLRGFNLSPDEVEEKFINTGEVDELLKTSSGDGVELFNFNNDKSPQDKSVSVEKRKQIIKLIKENKHPLLKKTLLASRLKYEKTEDRLLDIFNNNYWSKWKSKAIIKINTRLQQKSENDIIQKYSSEIDVMLNNVIEKTPELNVNPDNNFKIDVYEYPSQERLEDILPDDNYLDILKRWQADKALKGFTKIAEEDRSQSIYGKQHVIVIKNDLEIIGYAKIHNNKSKIYELSALDVMKSHNNNYSIYESLLTKVYDYVEENGKILKYNYGDKNHSEYASVVPDYIRKFESTRNSDLFILHGFNSNHGDAIDNILCRKMYSDKAPFLSLLNFNETQIENFQIAMKHLKIRFKDSLNPISNKTLEKEKYFEAKIFTLLEKEHHKCKKKTRQNKNKGLKL
jgi:hypothetical protein